MQNADWYDPISGSQLEQGDILLECDVFVPEQGVAGGDDDIPGFVDTLDLIVVTQTCDLEQSKVPYVLVARVVPWDEIVRAARRRENKPKSSWDATDMRKKLVRGHIHNLFLLHRADSFPWSVADFHYLHTLEREALEKKAGADNSRLRLRSPYREHFAQSFARYFMRVALPNDPEGSFSVEGDVPPDA